MDPTTCYKCGANTGVDPCWSCSAEQFCRNCSAQLEGPFCAECGTAVGSGEPAATPGGATAPVTSAAPEAAMPQSAASTAAPAAAATTPVPPAQPAAPQPPPPAVVVVREPPAEIPLEVDRAGLGSNLAWAYASFRSHWTTLAAVTAIAGVAWVAAFAISYIVLLVLEDLEIGLLWLVGVWLLAGLFLATSVYTWNMMVRSWHSLLLGTSPDLRWVIKPDRIQPVAIAVLLLFPITFIPFMAGFALVGLYFAIGERLAPMAALSEMISRCTASARTFWQTVVIGFLAALYGYAVAVAIYIMFVMNIGVATVSTVDSLTTSSQFAESSDADTTTLVLGLLMVVAVAIPLAFALFQLIGLWGVAYARRLAGRPLGVPDTTSSTPML